MDIPRLIVSSAHGDVRRGGLKVCAANFVAPETILNIEGYGECVFLDRMNHRFSHRVDIAMRKDGVVG